MENDSYLSKINKFNTLYSTNIQQILSNPKIEYRYFCYRYLDYIRNISLPNITLNNKNEAVIIECRKFPHLEFIIRNMILKLGSNWSHTVLCGNLNYDYMLNICKNISSNIKVIKIPFDNLSQSTYSTYMATLEFWNLLVGSKILIYQEDSCIFKNNINDFMYWDFIGAPLPKHQNDNPNHVGNGGFSLRTKQCMIDVINTIDIHSTKCNSDTLNYMRHCGMTVVPEDIYFTLNMLRYGIGIVADWDSAFKFSSESTYNPDSLGGHNFWMSNPQWKKHLRNNVVKQFQPKFCIDIIEHRGGLRSIIDDLTNKDFFNKDSQYAFYDLPEHHFIWCRENNIVCEDKWFGIIHCTHNTPDHLYGINVNKMFENDSFIKSLDNCVCLISLSKYLANFLQNKLKSINKNIPIKILKYPVDNKNIKLFTIENYINNNDKKIIHIGRQCRKLTSIYLLNTKLKKMWLTGTKDLNLCKEILQYEKNVLSISDLNENQVEMNYVLDIEEYDEILSKNIVFVDLFDASANNVVVECIIRNNPIIINKLPAVEEYLGPNYPLYFNTLDEIEDLLTIENLTKAHEYLKNIDKKEFNIDYFTKELINIANEYFN